MKLIGIGMVVDSNYIGKILNGSIQEVKSKGKNLVSFFKKNYKNKCYRMSHWVGHSDLKELEINDFFERKNVIEDMEAELTEAPKTSNTDNCRWLKRQMLMNTLLQKPRLAMIWKLILNNNGRHNQIKRQ